MMDPDEKRAFAEGWHKVTFPQRLHLRIRWIDGDVSGNDWWTIVFAVGDERVGETAIVIKDEGATSKQKIIDAGLKLVGITRLSLVNDDGTVLAY